MKTFTLFKRVAGKELHGDAASSNRTEPWYFRFEFRAVKYTRSLETPDADLAQQRARAKHKEITEAIISGEYKRLDGTKTRHQIFASLGDLVAAYRQCPAKASAATRESNIRAALNIFRHLQPNLLPATFLQTPYPQLLNAETAEAWFKLETISPQTANSLWRQAASLCGPHAQFTYKRLAILHPCLDEFAKTGRVCQRPVSKVTMRPPSDEIMAATLADWEKLEDRNLFLAIGHELAFGLRAGEVSQAKECWWTTKFGQPMLCATGNFKHNPEGYFEQPALDPYYTIMRTKAMARGWLTLKPTPANDPASPFIITGSNSYRHDGIEREVSSFLRALGWETTKTNHALRAYAGGQVAAKFGIYQAKEFLRHSSVKVTESHYMYLLRNPLIESIREKSPVRWARSDAAPILTILEKTA